MSDVKEQLQRVSARFVAAPRETQHVPVITADRAEFCRALVLQGYGVERAINLAAELEETDGALQMLARHRINFGEPSL